MRDPIRYGSGAKRAPKGGIDIAGKHYPGGQWIPGAVIAQASPQQQAQLGAGQQAVGLRQQAVTQERTAAGPVNKPALAAHIESAHKPGTLSAGDQRSARASWDLIVQKHGEHALHRVQEMAKLGTAALGRLPVNDPHRAALVRQLGILHHIATALHKEPAKAAPAPAKAPVPAPKSAPPPPAPKPPVAKPVPAPVAKPAPAPAPKPVPRVAQPTQGQVKPEVHAYRQASAAAHARRDGPPLVLAGPETTGDMLAAKVGEDKHAALMQTARQALAKGQTNVSRAQMAKAFGVPETHKMLARTPPEGKSAKGLLADYGIRRGQVSIATPKNEADLDRLVAGYAGLGTQEQKQACERLGVPQGTSAEGLKGAVQKVLKEDKAYLANPKHISDQIADDHVSNGIHESFTRTFDLGKADSLRSKMRELKQQHKAARTDKEQTRLAKEHNAALKELQNMSAQAREHIRSALLKVNGGNGARVAYAGQRGDEPSEYGHEQSQEAQRFLSGLAAKGAGHELLTQYTWDVSEHNERPAHVAKGRAVRTNIDDEAWDHVHELGHAIEEMPHIAAAANAFLAHRCGDEPPVSIKDAVGGTDRVRDNEMGRKDSFDKVFEPLEAYYVGKDARKGHTEIISMGLEQMYRDPVRFAHKDPEYFRFLCSVLHGASRRNPGE